MTQTLDTRKIPPEIRLSSLLDTLKLASPGSELEVVLPDEPTAILEGLLDEAGLGCWFSPVQPGRYRFVARHEGAVAGVSEYLGWDHDRLDGILQDALRAVGTADWRAARECALAFSHGLLRHIDVEENQLFPEFDNRTGMHEGGPTHVMRLEHEEIKEGVAGIVAAVERRDYDDLMRWHANLLGVLVEHNMKEEQILYPGIDRLLSNAERENLLRLILLS